jgi:hypothetical protein
VCLLQITSSSHICSSKTKNSVVLEAEDKVYLHSSTILRLDLCIGYAAIDWSCSLIFLEQICHTDFGRKINALC